MFLENKHPYFQTILNILVLLISIIEMVDDYQLGNVNVIIQLVNWVGFPKPIHLEPSWICVQLVKLFQSR